MAENAVPMPGPGGMMEGEIVQFKTEREEWNIYKLEDGTTLRTKLVAQQIMRGVDGNGNTIYLPTGEPLYNVRHNIQVVADVPKFLRKKDES